MKNRFAKTYKFAIVSAIYIALFSTLFVAFLTWFFYEFSILFCLYAALFFGAFSFLVLQYRVERFIYKNVKKIYDDVALIEAPTIRDKSVTTDIASLTREVQKFATGKKLEIEMLKVREEYRREFLGNVSHELKTPLFTVQGYLATLLGGAMKDKTVRKKYLQRAEKGVERLIYIVQDLDMISKLESGDLHLQQSTFDIVKLVQNVFDLLEMEASKKDIILLFDQKYSRPIIVRGDSEKLEQVIINLVVNSIKYGKDQGSTEVSIEELSNSKMIVRVKDDGEGIEPHNVPRLFERFFRVDKSGSRVTGGSGLGLAIVKHIIEAHNQKIYVQSEFGLGSEFSFTIEKAE